MLIGIRRQFETYSINGFANTGLDTEKLINIKFHIKSKSHGTTNNITDVVSQR
jgi:hypothetical protein